MAENYMNRVPTRGVDFHVHTTRSDGRYDLRRVLDLAVFERLSVIAITDHNTFDGEIVKLAPFYERQGLQVINGCEFTAFYYLQNGTKEEIHIVALNFEPEKLNGLFGLYSLNRRPYIEAILKRLKEEGVADITYEEMLEKYPTMHLGKMHISQELVSRKIVKDVYEGLDLYVGNLGLKKCWVPSEQYLDIPDMETVIRAIIDAGGTPVLAHPYYYKGLADNREREKLVSDFKSVAGERAGMEVYYKNYTAEQVLELERIAKKYKIRKSGGSDFHGWFESDHLAQISLDVNSLLTKTNNHEQCGGI